MTVKRNLSMTGILNQAKQVILRCFFQARHSFVPSQRRQPSRMPVIPLRSKRSVRRGQGVRLKDQLTNHLDDIKAMELSWIAILNFGIAVLLLVAGIFVVHFSYQNRQHVIELSELRVERDQLQQNWTYLMRDQNQLSEFSRIESTAMKAMQMHRPDKRDIYIMKRSVQ